jgi:hypothetical protein
VIGGVFAIDEIAAAHEFMAGRKSIGRTIVVI